MTQHGPPRLAMSLLTRCLPDDDPLIGDLVEDHANGRSAVWFWQQTLSALIAAWHRPSGGIRPLRLVSDPRRADPDPTPLWPRPSGGPLTYLAGSPVNGIGSLGILAVIVLITVVVPQIWLAVVTSLVAGTGLGIVLAKRTARRIERDRAAELGHVLFCNHVAPQKP